MSEISCSHGDGDFRGRDFDHPKVRARDFFMTVRGSTISSPPGFTSRR